MKYNENTFKSDFDFIYDKFLFAENQNKEKDHSARKYAGLDNDFEVERVFMGEIGMDC